MVAGALLNFVGGVFFPHPPICNPEWRQGGFHCEHGETSRNDVVDALSLIPPTTYLKPCPGVLSRCHSDSLNI